MRYGIRFGRGVPVARVLGCTLFTVVLSTGCGPAPEPEAPSVGDVFAHFDVDGSPGATVMVIQNGEVLHSDGYGSANLDTASPMTPSTPVRLASVSKAFTAMAVVILEEHGSVDFDVPVTQWVPELSRFPEVTLRHLMNHTSGLPDYYGDESPLQEMVSSLEGDEILTNVDAVSVYESWGEPVSAPGAQYAYSNPGYEILALVVERVSGMTFGEFLDAEIFTPLGMETAVVRDLPTTVIPGRAVGYRAGEGGDGWTERDDHWANWMVGAGGVYASLEDMYLWDQALHQWADSGERTREAFAPTVLNDGSISEYGFGWNTADQLGRTSISHNGGWVGFSTSFLRFPEEELSVIVLTNASVNAPELAHEVAELHLGGT